MHQKICSHILSCFRGSKTQLEMSRLLGFKSNQYYKLEAGTKPFRLSDFINLCLLTDRNLDELFSEGLGLSTKVYSAEEITVLVFRVWLPSDDQYISKKLGISKTRVWRLRNSLAEFDFIDFLKVVDIIADRLPTFLKELQVFDTLPAEIKNRLSYMELDFISQYYVEVSLLSTAIYLKQVREAPFKQKRKVLLKYSGLSSKKFDECFDFLLDNNLIYVSDGNYQVRSQKTELRGAMTDKKISKMLWLYLIDQFQERVTLDKPTTRRNFKLAPVSKHAKNEIRLLLSETYKKISKIIDEDDPLCREEIILLAQFLFSQLEEDDK